MDQLQPEIDQEIPQVAIEVEEAQEPHPVHRVPLRQSTQKRRPGHMFTYPSLGQPVYRLHPPMNAVDDQPMYCTHLFYPYPHPQTFQSQAITPYP